MRRGKRRVTCFREFKKKKRPAKSRHGPTVFKSRAAIESTGRGAIKFRASESSGSCSDTKTSSPGTGRWNQKAISGRPRATETECSSEVPLSYASWNPMHHGSLRRIQSRTTPAKTCIVSPLNVSRRVSMFCGIVTRNNDRKITSFMRDDNIWNRFWERWLSGSINR